MIGEKFTVNGKEYEIKKDITFGEYRKINSVNSKLNQLSAKFTTEDDLKKLPLDQLRDVSMEFASSSEEQMETMVNFLNSALGLTQEQLDLIPLNDAVQIFQEAFKLSTTPKKDLKKTSDSLYS